MMKSEAREKKGYWKVAGRFFSKTKCPIHAKKYPKKGQAIKYFNFNVEIKAINEMMTKLIRDVDQVLLRWFLLRNELFIMKKFNC